MKEQLVDQNAGGESDVRRCVFDEGGAGILIVQADGPITGANRMAVELLGYSSCEFEQMRFGELFQPSEEQYARTLLDTVVNTGRFSGEVSFRRKDRRPLVAEVSVRDFDGQSRDYVAGQCAIRSPAV